ncbi:MAG: hypothetical protein MN733_37275 [Nitrososphaera sp.]|nr:hypothetical protein [Nitrososphaera sp.]
MNLPATEEFEFQGKKFKITTTMEGSKFNVSVTLNEFQVSPTYSVDIITHQDYFMQHKMSLIGKLVEIAKSDIKNGMYYKG